MIMRKKMATHGLDLWQLARCWPVQVPHVDQLGNGHLHHYHDGDYGDHDNANYDGPDEESVRECPRVSKSIQESLKVFENVRECL